MIKIQRESGRKTKRGWQALLILAAFFLMTAVPVHAQSDSTAGTGLARIPLLDDAKQKKVNDEANTFKLTDVIDTSTVDSDVGDGTHLTGLRRMNEEEEVEMRKPVRVVKNVRLNKIGLARINEVRAKKKLKLLKAGQDFDVAPVGEDVELSAPGSGTFPATGGAEAAQAAAVPAGTLPSYVDNSALQYFPPIRQQSGNSCAHFSGIYYNMTHEMALTYGWNAKSGGDDYRYAPMFAYNLLNDGLNNGSWFTAGWDISQYHGIPRWSEFHTTSIKAWCMNAAAYRNALTSRTDNYDTIFYLNTDAGLQLLKSHLNNGHTAVYATYVNSWKDLTVNDDPSTSDDDAFVGKRIYYMVNGKLGAHGMTVVGYNDNIWCDINTNGVVEANEKGALRVANSWGTGWNESGFSWIAYDALRTRNPAYTSEGIFCYDGVYFITTRPQQYAVSVVARLTINHNLRNQVHMEVGTGAVGATSPSITEWPQILDYQGGAYAFDGSASTSQDFTYYLDLTPFASLGTAKRWFVKGTDRGSNNGDLTIKSFELYYNNAGTDQIVGVAANMPKVANGNTQYAWIDWTMGDTSRPTVQWATASQTSTNESGTMTVTAQLNAALADTFTVPFTVAGTASDADYSISASSITIPAGTTTGTVTVTITADTLDETNETVILTMGTPTNTNVLLDVTRVHTVTITDDDAAPKVAWTAASQASANESGTLTVTAQLSVVSGQAVTVPFTVTGTATSGTDYTNTASPLTIPVGALSASVTITIVGDTLDEANETVILTMGKPTNAVKGATTVHTATITDDDNTPPIARTLYGNVPTVWLATTVPSSTNNYEVAAAADPDNDGYTTAQEYWSGTDPLVSSSHLKIDSFTLEGANIVLRWQHAAVGAGIPPLEIQATTNLNTGPWINVGFNAPINGSNSWDGIPGTPYQFYKLAVTNAP